jgi:hypothetical protein
MWIVPKAKHNQSVIVAPDQYARRTVAFFCKYLAGEAVAEAAIAPDDSPAAQSDVA